VASTATALGVPLILVPPRAQAATELNMIAWYGHGEPDMVEEFEAKHNVKIKAKYYAGGDNMLALISQSPPAHTTSFFQMPSLYNCSTRPAT